MDEAERRAIADAEAAELAGEVEVVEGGESASVDEGASAD